jgi:hypothetical protein
MEKIWFWKLKELKGRLLTRKTWGTRSSCKMIHKRNNCSSVRRNDESFITNAGTKEKINLVNNGVDPGIAFFQKQNQFGYSNITINVALNYFFTTV